MRELILMAAGYVIGYGACNLRRTFIETRDNDG